MGNMAAQRAALAAALGTITGLRVKAYLAPNVDGLTAMVGAPTAGDLEEAFGGEGSHDWEIWLLYAGLEWERAQAAIDPYLAPSGASSIVAALNASADLDGSIGPIRYREYGPVEWAGKNYFGVKILVNVLE